MCSNLDQKSWDDMSKCACDIWYIYICIYIIIYILSLSFISAFPLHPQTSHQGPLRQRDFCRITTVWGVWDAFGSVPHRLFASFPGCFPSFHWQEHSPTRSLRNIGRLEIPNWRSSTTSWNSFLSTGRLWPPLSVKNVKSHPHHGHTRLITIRKPITNHTQY